MADASSVADSTILRFETGKGGMQTGTLAKIRETLEQAGIVFLEADDRHGPGVRLKTNPKTALEN